GDEAFGGYPEYRRFPQLERIKSALGPLKSSVAATAEWVNSRKKLQLLEKYAPLLSIAPEEYYLGRTALPNPTFRTGIEQLYSREFSSEIDHQQNLWCARQYFRPVTSQPLVNQMLYVDTKTWLPDDLLIKADKITMANSVELRVPLLDHRV